MIAYIKSKISQVYSFTLQKAFEMLLGPFQSFMKDSKSSKWKITEIKGFWCHMSILNTSVEGV